MSEITVGHVTSRREGNDLHLKCNNCGYKETVIDYANGKRPQNFVWIIKFDGTEYVKCEKCGKDYERTIRGAR